MKILIINGPNLNLLGKRDPEQYGNLTLKEINAQISEKFPMHEFTFIQSNHEGEIIDAIQDAESNGFSGIVINPGGYSHSSVAIRDALEIVKIPKIEVHLSNLTKREDYRQKNITATATNGYLSGFGEKGYSAAIYLLEEIALR